MLRIVHHMYITRLRWRVAVHPTVLVQTAAADEASSDSGEKGGMHRHFNLRHRK
jgi:hypothetical protein